MGKKDKAETKAAEMEKGNVIFYCDRGQYTFSLPEFERDEFGNIITDEKGKKKHLVTVDADGGKHKAYKDYKFDRVPVKDPKSGKTSAIIHLGRFVVTPDDENRDELLAAMVRAMKNPINGVMTEDQYKAQHNPEAFGFEKEKLALANEVTAVKDENAALRAKLAEAGITV
jgi:signal peptidase I